MDTSGEICEALASKFSDSSRNRAQTQESQRKGTDQSATLKRTRELKVLDKKTAQNLMIALTSSKVTTDELARYIITVDEAHLNAGILENLIRQLPPRQQLDKLEEFRSQIDELDEAEKFALTLGSIKRLEYRLKSIQFKLGFDEQLGNIKQGVAAVTTACEEIINSKKLDKIMAYLLLFGNVLNSGSERGKAYGFEMSFLTKLETTKSKDNKTTLLHFLVDTVERKEPCLLNFYEEISAIDRAKGINPEQLQKLLNDMKASIRELGINLKVFEPHDSDDRFGEVMSKFSRLANDGYELLQNMLLRMNNKYQDLAKYYAFDPEKYKMEEIFNEIREFKLKFIRARTEIVKLREIEEKNRRRAYMEREKRERTQKKIQTYNMANTEANGDIDSGVMDNLMSRLESGSYASRLHPGRRRLATRPGAGFPLS